MKSLFIAVLTFFIMAATPASALDHHLEFMSDFLHDRQVDGTVSEYEIDIYQDGVLIKTIESPSESVFWSVLNGWRHVVATPIPYSDTKITTITLRHIPSGISSAMSNGVVYGDECWDYDFVADGVISILDFASFRHQFSVGSAGVEDFAFFRSYFGKRCN